jgi:hypothetical protein
VDLLGSGASTTHLPDHVQAALNGTYVSALSTGLYAVGGLALVGSLLAWTLVRKPTPAQLAVPADAALAAVPHEHAETSLAAHG